MIRVKWPEIKFKIKYDQSEPAAHITMPEIKFKSKFKYDQGVKGNDILINEALRLEVEQVLGLHPLLHLAVFSAKPLTFDRRALLLRKRQKHEVGLLCTLRVCSL